MPGGRHHRAAVTAHAAPRLCHPFAQPRRRSARGADAAGACRYFNHHHLHPRGTRAAQVAAAQHHPAGLRTRVDTAFRPGQVSAQARACRCAQLTWWLVRCNCVAARAKASSSAGFAGQRQLQERREQPGAVQQGVGHRFGRERDRLQRLAPWAGPAWCRAARTRRRQRRCRIPRAAAVRPPAVPSAGRAPRPSCPTAGGEPPDARGGQQQGRPAEQLLACPGSSPRAGTR